MTVYKLVSQGTIEEKIIDIQEKKKKLAEQVLEGEGLFTVDGVEHTVAAGQVLVMPAGKPHAVYAPRSFKMLLTVVFPRKE